MEDHDFLVVRKNLNILSALILILAFSSAQISELDFLGIDLKLDGRKFYLSLYILYGYFIWRYLTKLPWTEGFVKGFSDFLTKKPDGLRREFNNAVGLNKVFSGTDSYKLLSLDADEKKSYELTLFIPNRLTAIVEFQLFYRSDEVFGNTNGDPIRTSYRMGRIYFTKKMIRYCLKYDEFGDFIFPLVPIFAFLLFFFLKSDWQGNFSSLLF